VLSCFVREIAVTLRSVYVIRAVHKFHFGLAITETPNKPLPAERRSPSARDSCFWQGLYVYTRPSTRILTDSIHAVQATCILLIKWQYYRCVMSPCWYRSVAYGDGQSVKAKGDAAHVIYRRPHWTRQSGKQIRPTTCTRHGSRGIAPLILNLRTGWWWMISFTPPTTICGG
jgi:hypothetical protein